LGEFGLFCNMEYFEKQIEQIEQKINEAKKLLTDPSLDSLAKEEISALETEKQNLLAAKNPKITETPNETSPAAVILEIRAAAGGDEAGIFAADLYRMYLRYAGSQNWESEQISINEGGVGNIKEVVFRIQGKAAYNKLLHESGVHRVQRVPSTESGGRIHTSTVTVAVLPEIKESEFHLDQKDLRVETFRASGHGGQNVQKVETAVRITHLPTNLAVTCQSERSQFQNKERALQVLRSRLYEAKKQAEKDGVDLSRKLQIGAGQRSEKIRTYNFPQNRVTDHRLNKSWYDLENIMNGNLGKITSKLKGFDSER